MTRDTETERIGEGRVELKSWRRNHPVIELKIKKKKKKKGAGGSMRNRNR